MNIEVKLFSYLVNMQGKNENRCSLVLEIENGATCQDLLQKLRIPASIPVIIMVNGSAAEEDTVLQAGDRVSILPPIGGG
jgi:molybdopterin synthase sulfur carrier subunit